MKNPKCLIHPHLFSKYHDLKFDEIQYCILVIGIHPLIPINDGSKKNHDQSLAFSQDIHNFNWQHTILIYTVDGCEILHHQKDGLKPIQNHGINSIYQLVIRISLAHPL